MPKVSVIINCLNGAEYLREALDSVFNQKFADWEIIFWDNASTDDSAAIAKSYGDRVRYFRSEETYTLGKARKLAFAQALGDFIAILDSDDIWLPEKLERQIPLFEKNENVGLTFSDSVIFDKDGDKYRCFQFVNPERGMIFGSLIEKNFISSETMIIRKSAYETLKSKFDEEFTIVMDNAMALRIAHDYEVDYVEAVLSKYRVHEKSTTSRKKRLLGEENERLIKKLVKEYPELGGKYKSEMQSYDRRVCYQRAMYEWEAGDVRRARKYLRRHMYSKKFAALFAASFIVHYRMLGALKTWVRFLMRKFPR